MSSSKRSNLDQLLRLANEKIRALRNSGQNKDPGDVGGDVMAVFHWLKTADETSSLSPPRVARLGFKIEGKVKRGGAGGSGEGEGEGRRGEGGEGEGERRGREEEKGEKGEGGGGGACLEDEEVDVPWM